jgi:hypothetical protein
MSADALTRSAITKDERAAVTSPDRDFERRTLLARLRWNLERLALHGEPQIRRDNIRVTANDLALVMARELAHTKPRSRFVPWHLDEAIVDAAINRVAREIATELYPAC